MKFIYLFNYYYYYFSVLITNWTLAPRFSYLSSQVILCSKFDMCEKITHPKEVQVQA